MPDVQRTVSTLLKIDGEAQYKSAITNINRELRTMRENVKLANEQFRGQANTTAALESKLKMLSAQQQKMSEKVGLSKDALSKAQSKVKEYTAEIERLRTKIASEGDAEGKYAKQLETAEINLQKAQNATEKYSGDVAKSETELTKVNNAIKDHTKYLDEATNSTNGTATSIDKYGKEVKTASSETEEFGTTGKEAFDKLASALIAAGLIKSAKELVDIFKQAAEASIEFETAITGVYKTVEGTNEQLAAVTDEIKRMATEIPLTTTELAAIAEAAGQLGIATDDVTAFATVMAALGVSTNLASTEAATQLARFAKITGLTADKYDELGSTIVELGNKSATTESEIVDMATNIASAGTTLGWTQAQIMGVSAALSSVGLESQAGGTAISKLMINMATAVASGSDELAQFADAAGMTSEQFAALFNSNSVDALSAFFDGLGSGSESAILMLNEMGITETRLRDTILRLTNAQGILTTSVATANAAFAENTALTTESEKFYATTESKVQLLKNSVQALGVTIGDRYNPALREALDLGTDATDAINDFLQENPAAVQAVTGFAAAIAAMAIALSGALVLVNVLIPAIRTLGIALKTTGGTVGIVVTVLASLAAGLAAASMASDETSEAFDEAMDASESLRESIDSAREAFEEETQAIESQQSVVSGLINKLDVLMGSQADNKDNSVEIKNVVDQLNSAVSDLGLTYDETTGSLNMTTAAIRVQTQAMYAAKLATAYVDQQVAAEVALDSMQKKRAADQDELDAATARYNGSLRHVTTYLNGVKTSYDAPTAKTAKYKKEVDEATEAVAADSEEIEQLTEDLEYYEEKVTSAGSATSNAADELSTAADEFESAKGSVESLSEALDSAYESAKNAVEQTSGLFNDLDGKGKKTISNLTKTTDKQTEFWDNYTSNLEKAKEAGLNEDLLGQLADGTEESAQYLDSIVKGTSGSIEELNAAYESNKAAQEAFQLKSAEVQEQVGQLFDDMTQDIEDFVMNSDRSSDTYDAGVETIKGLIAGLLANYPGFKNAVDQYLAYLSNLSGVDISVTGDWGSTTSQGSGNIKAQKFATGLDRVPYDEFPAILHKDEAVLTAQEALTWRSLKARISERMPTGEQMTGNYQQSTSARSSGDDGSNGSTVNNYHYEVSQSFQSNTMTPSQVGRETRRELRRLSRS